MQGLVTVFGGSGFIGSQVVRALAKRGHRVRVAVRRPWLAYRMRMLGDVGQIETVQANVRAPDSVARALDGAQGCVNLVGVLYEAGRQKFDDLHAEGAQTIATLAQSAGVQRLIHISAIGADANGAAKYARSKAMGEAVTRGAFPAATLLRPSIVFGQGDSFFNRFAAMAASPIPVLPLIGGGATRFQPVFIGDVASAVAGALQDPSTAGATYELGGPGIYTFKALLELICQETGRHPILLPIPFPLASLIGAVGDIQSVLLPPLLTSDQVTLLKQDKVVAAGARGLADLGIQATSVEAIIPSYLYRFRKGGQYADAIAGGV